MLCSRSVSLTLLPSLFAFAPLAQGQVGVRPDMDLVFSYLEEGETELTYSSSLPFDQQSFTLGFEDPTWVAGPVGGTGLGDRAGAWVILATHVWVDELATDDAFFNTYPMLRPVKDGYETEPSGVLDFAEDYSLTDADPQFAWLNRTNLLSQSSHELKVLPSTLGFMLQYAMAGEPNIKEWGQHVHFTDAPQPQSSQKTGWSTYESYWVPGSTPGVTMGYSNQKWNPAFAGSSGGYAGEAHTLCADRIAQAAILEQDAVLGMHFLRNINSLSAALVNSSGQSRLRLTIQPIIIRSSAAGTATFTESGFTTHGLAQIGNDVFFAPQIDIAVLRTASTPPGDECDPLFEFFAPGVVGVIGDTLYLTMGWDSDVDTASVEITENVFVDMPALRLDPIGGFVVVPNYPASATGVVKLFLKNPNPACDGVWLPMVVN